MRPVNKWMPGLIKLESGEVWKIDEDYRPYQNAKSSLCRNLGIMCSYCEKTSFDERDFAVEHIQPKKYKDASGNYIYSALENGVIFCSLVLLVMAQTIKILKMWFMENVTYLI